MVIIIVLTNLSPFSISSLLLLGVWKLLVMHHELRRGEDVPVNVCYQFTS
jgi:hypothetical protein